jgi:hypothetical protein
MGGHRRFRARRRSFAGSGIAWYMCQSCHFTAHTVTLTVTRLFDVKRNIESLTNNID